MTYFSGTDLKICSEHEMDLNLCKCKPTKFNLSEKIMIDQWDKEKATSKIFTEDVKEFIKRLKDIEIDVTELGLSQRSLNILSHKSNNEIDKLAGDKLI